MLRALELRLQDSETNLVRLRTLELWPQDSESIPIVMLRALESGPAVQIPEPALSKA